MDSDRPYLPGAMSVRVQIELPWPRIFHASRFPTEQGKMQNVFPLDRHR